jgi:hypothetical protein
LTLICSRDTKLLSFGEGEEDVEEPVTVKKNMARPDCECFRR